jgi:hypothetical protein
MFFRNARRLYEPPEGRSINQPQGRAGGRDVASWGEIADAVDHATTKREAAAVAWNRIYLTGAANRLLKNSFAARAWRVTG